jgi:AraC family transcriptional regulator, regulatory protein of adaptative response / methylated-DNA-[protein]-cysteine methyltransferase
LIQLSDLNDMSQTDCDNDFDSLGAFYDAFAPLLDAEPTLLQSEPIHYTRILTPLGPMLAAATGAALCLMEFTDRRMLATQLKRLRKKLGGVPVLAPNPVLDRTQHEMDEYFAGRLRTFAVPLAPAGSEFQRRAWQMLTQIPYGMTRSYGEQAVIIGQPTATRAVARANGDNPIAIIVPCHRVLGADGKLTGYGGGLWRKRWLLDHEQDGALPMTYGERLC